MVQTEKKIVRTNELTVTKAALMIKDNGSTFTSLSRDDCIDDDQMGGSCYNTD